MSRLTIAMENKCRSIPRLEKLFLQNLPANFQAGDDAISQLLLREYGAVYVARGGAIPPTSVIFRDDAEVKQFQSRVPAATEQIGAFKISLQAPAMAALTSAIQDARAAGLTITPRGADSGSRNYAGTVALWHSRVEPALEHWSSAGRIDNETVSRIRSLSPFEQVSIVLGLEEKGIYFAKDLSKSVIYSVAPPGTSQHLAMLAFDVAEFDHAGVRNTLSKRGWFQTVTSDLPHFTFLGVPEEHLPELGLVRLENAGRSFWVPRTVSPEPRN